MNEQAYSSIWNFYQPGYVGAEFNPDGVELDIPPYGAIILVEDDPIVEVTVIGSACVPPGFVLLFGELVEWKYPRSGVKMRVDNLWCEHVRIGPWRKGLDESYRDAVMVLAPFYYPNPSDEVVYQHYKAIADATDIGIMIYNNATVTGKDMSVDCLMRLGEIEHIIALKETTANIFKLREVAHKMGDRFTLNVNTYRTLSPLDYQFGVVDHNNYLLLQCTPSPEFPIDKNILK